MALGTYVKFPISNRITTKLLVTQSLFTRLVNSNRSTAEVAYVSGISRRTVQELRKLVKETRQTRREASNILNGKPTRSSDLSKFA